MKGHIKGKVDTHNNIENTNKMEHNIYTYETENTKL